MIVMVSLHVNYDFLRLSPSVALVSMPMRKINISLLRIHSNNYVCLRFALPFGIERKSLGEWHTMTNHGVSLCS